MKKFLRVVGIIMFIACFVILFWLSIQRFNNFGYEVWPLGREVWNRFWKEGIAAVILGIGGAGLFVLSLD